MTEIDIDTLPKSKWIDVSNGYQYLTKLIIAKYGRVLICYVNNNESEIYYSYDIVNNYGNVFKIGSESSAISATLDTKFYSFSDDLLGNVKIHEACIKAIWIFPIGNQKMHKIEDIVSLEKREKKRSDKILEAPPFQEAKIIIADETITFIQISIYEYRITWEPSFIINKKVMLHLPFLFNLGSINYYSGGKFIIEFDKYNKLSNHLSELTSLIEFLKKPDLLITIEALEKFR